VHVRLRGRCVREERQKSVRSWRVDGSADSVSERTLDRFEPALSKRSSGTEISALCSIHMGVGASGVAQHETRLGPRLHIPRAGYASRFREALVLCVAWAGKPRGQTLQRRLRHCAREQVGPVGAVGAVKRKEIFECHFVLMRKCVAEGRPENTNVPTNVPMQERCLPRMSGQMCVEASQAGRRAAGRGLVRDELTNPRAALDSAETSLKKKRESGCKVSFAHINKRKPPPTIFIGKRKGHRGVQAVARARFINDKLQNLEAVIPTRGDQRHRKRRRQCGG
jgi:hypothetical protein